MDDEVSTGDTCVDSKRSDPDGWGQSDFNLQPSTKSDFAGEMTDARDTRPACRANTACLRGLKKWTDHQGAFQVSAQKSQNNPTTAV